MYIYEAILLGVYFNQLSYLRGHHLVPVIYLPAKECGNAMYLINIMILVTPNNVYLYNIMIRPKKNHGHIPGHHSMIMILPHNIHVPLCLLVHWYYLISQNNAANKNTMI